MQPMVNTSPGASFLFRKKNVWYSTSDGNWSDPNLWLSNRKKRGQTVPQPGDDVYLYHNVTLDANNISIACLFGPGKLIFGTTARNFTVKDRLDMSGTIDMNNAAHNLYLAGYENNIGEFLYGTSGTVIYERNGDQTVSNISYCNLITQNSGTKYQISDLIVNGTINAQSNYECGPYNLSVYGNSVLGSAGHSIFSKAQPGNLLFVGYADFEGVDLSGNPDIEFRGGMMIHAFTVNTGNGTFTYSTNDQNIDCPAYLGGTWDANIIVKGNIILTLTGSSIFKVNGTINGTESTSTFNNTGTLYLGNNVPPMSIGIFNYQYSNSSTLGYVFDGSYSLPYSNYTNLYLAGSGTKYASSNITISNTFTNSGNFECSGNNLVVNGSFINQGGFTASTYCNLLFKGSAYWGVNTGAYGIDLRIGNPDVEFQNGLEVHSQSCYTGTGTFAFTSSNQIINFSAFNFGICEANFLIKGGITVTFNGATSSAPMLGVLDGDSSSSKFINGGTFNYNNSQEPMLLGIFDSNTLSNSFIYSLNGNQDISPGTYFNLTFSGGGIKKLLGNVSVINTYTLLSPATLSNNNFSLTTP